MKTWIVGMLLTASLFAQNAGAPATATAGPITAASPSEPPEWGGCRWQCPNTGRWFTSAASCDAACTAECDEIC